MDMVPIGHHRGVGGSTLVHKQHVWVRSCPHRVIERDLSRPPIVRELQGSRILVFSDDSSVDAGIGDATRLGVDSRAFTFDGLCGFGVIAEGGLGFNERFSLIGGTALPPDCILSSSLVSGMRFRRWIHFNNAISKWYRGCAAPRISNSARPKTSKARMRSSREKRCASAIS